MGEYPFVSVIIPVLNDRDRLEICLQALEKQTYPPELYEAIIVDNGSVENIESLIKKFPQASLIFEVKRGSYAARNKGISLAKGEIIAFTDSDCIPAPNWLEAGVRQLLLIPNCGFVAGKIKILFQDKNFPTAVEVFDSIFNLQQEKYVQKYHYGATANLFTFKKIFEEVGYFNFSLKSGGDAEWGGRVFARGYSIIYADDTCVEHPARNSLAQLTKKVIRQTGGSYDKEKNQKQKRAILITSLLGFRPPLRSAFRKAFSTDTLKSRSRRLKLFFIILLIYYVSFFEKLRLQLGDKSKW
jgi:glycosyltransferase involved in cell wall biosynthesis